MSEISVIVPARDAAATIGRTLEALAAQDTDAQFEVVVVDDGSRDETVEIARRAPGPVRVITQAGAGPGPARNRGVAESTGRILAFTDADCFPAPGWLSAGLAGLERSDAAQGAVRPERGVRPMPFDRTIVVDGRGGLYETANLLVRRDLFNRLGGFEDWLGPVLGKPLAEDVWFGWRARRAGARVVFCDDALVEHAVFRRSLREYLADRLRLTYFPALVRRIPELRRELLVGRLFLNRRTAAFDLLVAGAVTALALSSPLPLAAGIPYLWLLLTSAMRWRVRAPLAAIGDLLADAAGAVALLAGSVRYRAPVL
jgi:glycosyltransferase involved in cell wall biosynthesis